MMDSKITMKLNTKRLHDIKFTAAYDHDKDTRIYLRGDYHEKYLGYGISFKPCDNSKHALELQVHKAAINSMDPLKLLMKSPFYLRWGCVYNFPNGLIWKSNIFS